MAYFLKYTNKDNGEKHTVRYGTRYSAITDAETLSEEGHLYIRIVDSKGQVIDTFSNDLSEQCLPFLKIPFIMKETEKKEPIAYVHYRQTLGNALQAGPADS